MILKVLLIFVLAFQFATAQYKEAAVIDASQTTERTNCINHEKVLATMFTSFSAKISDVISNLTAEFLSKNLVTAFTNLKSLVDMQATINSWMPYENISTCGDINYKIVSMELEQQRYLRVRSRAIKNATDFYLRYVPCVQYSVEVISSNYYALVSSALADARSIYAEYNKYQGITLIKSYSNCAVNSNLLNTFKRTYCSCLKSAQMSTGTYNSTLETTVGFIENALKKLQEAVKNRTVIALTTCRNSYTSITSE